MTSQSTSKLLVAGTLLLVMLGAPLLNNGRWEPSDFGGASLFVDEVLEMKHELSQQTSRSDDWAKPYMRKLECDVVVVGGGTGGVAAALSAAREGAETCLIEETNWVGGMLTAAGVAAIDGHRDTPSGLFKEFIDNVSEWYDARGRLAETDQCGVSYFCFEPSVGNRVLKKMLGSERNLKVYLNAELTRAYRTGNKVEGVAFHSANNQYLVRADVTIDATEFGDVMYLANVPFDLGVDELSSVKEKRELQCVQPLTYVALLKYFGKDMTIEKPKRYEEENYSCLTKGENCPDSNTLFSKERLLKYGRLPDGKVMLNIPSHSYGNDFHATAPELEDKGREEILEMAKDYTLGLIYYMQTELGFQNYGIYNDFGSSDNFALMPYVRESRRLVGMTRLTKEDVMPISGRSKVIDDSIAIGDYPIDLHFCETGHGDIYFSIPPYQVPYGVTVPQEVDGFMAVEKNISVSHLVNGTTRLQPVTMSVGQAVGIASALSSRYKVEPRHLDVAEIQNELLDANSELFYFRDLSAGHYAYNAVAKLAMKGVVVGYRDLEFRPAEGIRRNEFYKIVDGALQTLDGNHPSHYSNSSALITRDEVAKFLATEVMDYHQDDYLEEMQKLGIVSDARNFVGWEVCKRADAAVMLVRTFNAVGLGF